MELDISISELLEFYLHEVTFFWPTKTGEDGIGAILAVNDFIAISIYVCELLWIAVEPSFHFSPPIFEFGFGVIVGTEICEYFDLGQ